MDDNYDRRIQLLEHEIDILKQALEEYREEVLALETRVEELEEQ